MVLNAVPAPAYHRTRGVLRRCRRSRLSRFQNEYLPEGAGEVNAVVTITAADTAGAAAPRHPPAARDQPPSDHRRHLRLDGRIKIREARSAVRRGDRLHPDGVQFAVIAGDRARPHAVPVTRTRGRGRKRRHPLRRQARSRQTRGRAVARPSAAWISLATELFAGQDRGIHHAILLTDGKDEQRDPGAARRGARAPPRAASSATAGASASNWVVSGAAQGRRPRCSEPSTSSPTPMAWPPTSRR